MARLLLLYSVLQLLTLSFQLKWDKWGRSQMMSLLFIELPCRWGLIAGTISIHTCCKNCALKCCHTIFAVLKLIFIFSCFSGNYSHPLECFFFFLYIFIDNSSVSYKDGSWNPLSMCNSRDLLDSLFLCWPIYCLLCMWMINTENSFSWLLKAVCV